MLFNQFPSLTNQLPLQSATKAPIKQQLITKLLLIYLVLLQTSNCQSDRANFTTTNPITSVTASYKLDIMQTTLMTIPANSVVTVSLPTQYSDVLESKTYTCYVNTWPSALSSPTPACSVTALTLTVSSIFPNDYTVIAPGATYSLTIDGISNPLEAGRTGSFTIRIINPANTVLLSVLSDFGNGITISTGRMTCVLTADPTQVDYDQSKMILSITPTKKFPSDTVFTITLPFYWPRVSQQLGFNQILNVTSQPNCIAISPNVQVSIGCTVTATSSFSISVTNVLAAETSSMVQFSFSQIRNPPSIEAQGSIDIVSRRSSNSKTMERCSLVKMTGITSGELSPASFTMDSKTVGSQGTGYLEFTVHQSMASTDQLRIKFPAQIGLSKLSYVSMLNGIVQVFAPSTTNNILTMGMGVMMSSSSRLIMMQLSNLTNPTSETPSSAFVIETYRNGHLMEELKTQLKYTARRGTISLVSAGATSVQIGARGNYEIFLSLEHASNLKSNSVLVVKVPLAYQGRIGGCLPSPCTITASQVTFLSIVVSIVSSQVTIQLQNVDNPLSLGVTSSFRAHTLQSPSVLTSVVDEITSGITYNLVARQMSPSDISLSSSSDTVFHFPTQYKFIIKNNNDLPKFSYLTILLPPTVLADIAVYCTYDSLSIGCDYLPATHSVRIDYFSAASVIAATQLSAAELVVGNLYNPTSTRQTSSFQFEIYNINSELIEFLRTGVNFAVGTPADFTTISLTMDNTKNSAVSQMTVKFTIPMPTYQPSPLMQITFPTQISLSSVGCTALSSNLISISCTSSANSLKAQLQYSNDSSSIETSFMVSNFKNYPSLKPFRLTLQFFATSLQQVKICSSANQLAQTTKANNQLGGMVLGSYSFSNRVLFEDSNLYIDLIETDYRGFSFLVVRFPSEFAINPGGCILPSGYTCAINQTNYDNSFVITVASGSFVFPFQFTLRNILTPKFTPSSKVYLETYTSGSYLIDRNSDILFATACTLPCKGCVSTVLSSQCTSCYSDPTLVSNLVILSGNTCRSVCPIGQYEDTNTASCVPCSTNCESCQNFNICLSCNNNRYLHLQDCLTDCLIGFYKYSARCLPCDKTTLHCESCANSYECLTCEAPYLVYSKVCYLICPALITYANTLTKTCEACPANCLQCTGDYTLVTCSKCANGYVLDNGGCYVDCVTSGLVKSNGQCVACSTLCGTCSLTTTNCTSCAFPSSNPYHFNFKCLSTCPSTFFNDNSTYTCSKCTSPCEQCTSVSISSCESCLTPYLLAVPVCLSLCDPGFYKSGYSCVQCTNDCQQCTSEFVCTSCGTGKYLHGTRCVGQCDPGMTVVNGNQCLVCNAMCKTCSSANFSYCLSCYNAVYLYNGTCSVVCPAGTYRDGVNFVCIGCVGLCKECQSGSICDSCVNAAHVLEGGACLSMCTAPLINVSSVCVACSGECATCQSAVNRCVLCASGQYFNSTSSACTVACSALIILPQDSASTNSECVLSCPSKFYALNSICTACPGLCSLCSSAGNCSACVNSSVILHEEMCYSSCPVSAPYLYKNATCRVCNIGGCLNCLNESYCRECEAGLLLVENVTRQVDSVTNTASVVSNVSSCVASCGSGYVYNVSRLDCEAIPANNSNNTSNQTQNQTQNPTANTTVPTAASIKLLKSSIPTYTSLYFLAGFFAIFLISKLQFPTSNFVICLLVGAGLCNALILGNVTFMQLYELITNNPGKSIGQVMTQSMSLSSFIILSAGVMHVVANGVALIGILVVRDYALISLLEENHVMGLGLLVLFVVDAKCILLLNSGMMGWKLFSLKYCAGSMVKLIKAVLGLTLVKSLIEGAYSIILFINKMQASTTVSRLLLQTANSSPQDGYLIELIVTAGLIILLSIFVLMMKQSNYFIPDKNSHLSYASSSQKVSSIHNEQNESMKSIMDEKDVIGKRNHEELLLSLGDSDLLQDFSRNQINRAYAAINHKHDTKRTNHLEDNTPELDNYDEEQFPQNHPTQHNLHQYQSQTKLINASLARKATKNNRKGLATRSNKHLNRSLSTTVNQTIQHDDINIFDQPQQQPQAEQEIVSPVQYNHKPTLVDKQEETHQQRQIKKATTAKQLQSSYAKTSKNSQQKPRSTNKVSELKVTKIYDPQLSSENISQLTYHPKHQYPTQIEEPLIDQNEPRLPHLQHYPLDTNHNLRISQPDERLQKEESIEELEIDDNEQSEMKNINKTSVTNKLSTTQQLNSTDRPNISDRLKIVKSFSPLNITVKNDLPAVDSIRQSGAHNNHNKKEADNRLNMDVQDGDDLLESVEIVQFNQEESCMSSQFTKPNLAVTQSVGVNLSESKIKSRQFSKLKASDIKNQSLNQRQPSSMHSFTKTSLIQVKPKSSNLHQLKSEGEIDQIISEGDIDQIIFTNEQSSQQQNTQTGNSQRGLGYGQKFESTLKSHQELRHINEFMVRSDLKQKPLRQIQQQISKQQQLKEQEQKPINRLRTEEQIHDEISELVKSGRAQTHIHPETNILQISQDMILQYHSTTSPQSESRSSIYHSEDALSNLNELDDFETKLISHRQKSVRQQQEQQQISQGALSDSEQILPQDYNVEAEIDKELQEHLLDSNRSQMTPSPNLIFMDDPHILQTEPDQNNNKPVSKGSSSISQHYSSLNSSHQDQLLSESHSSSRSSTQHSPSTHELSLVSLNHSELQLNQLQQLTQQFKTTVIDQLAASEHQNASVQPSRTSSQRSHAPKSKALSRSSSKSKPKSSNAIRNDTIEPIIPIQSHLPNETQHDKPSPDYMLVSTRKLPQMPSNMPSFKRKSNPMEMLQKIQSIHQTQLQNSLIHTNHSKVPQQEHFEEIESPITIEQDRLTQIVNQNQRKLNSEYLPPFNQQYPKKSLPKDKQPTTLRQAYKKNINQALRPEQIDQDTISQSHINKKPIKKNINNHGKPRNLPSEQIIGPSPLSHVVQQKKYKIYELNQAQHLQKSIQIANTMQKLNVNLASDPEQEVKLKKSGEEDKIGSDECSRKGSLSSKGQEQEGQLRKNSALLQKSLQQEKKSQYQKNPSKVQSDHFPQEPMQASAKQPQQQNSARLNQQSNDLPSIQGQKVVYNKQNVNQPAKQTQMNQEGARQYQQEPKQWQQQPKEQNSLKINHMANMRKSFLKTKSQICLPEHAQTSPHKLYQAQNQTTENKPQESEQRRVNTARMSCEKQSRFEEGEMLDDAVACHQKYTRPLLDKLNRNSQDAISEEEVQIQGQEVILFDQQQVQESQSQSKRISNGIQKQADVSIEPKQSSKNELQEYGFKINLYFGDRPPSQKPSRAQNLSEQQQQVSPTIQIESNHLSSQKQPTQVSKKDSIHKITFEEELDSLNQDIQTPQWNSKNQQTVESHHQANTRNKNTYNTENRGFKKILYQDSTDHAYQGFNHQNHQPSRKDHLQPQFKPHSKSRYPPQSNHHLVSNQKDSSAPFINLYYDPTNNQLEPKKQLRKTSKSKVPDVNRLSHQNIIPSYPPKQEFSQGSELDVELNVKPSQMLLKHKIEPHRNSENLRNSRSKDHKSSKLNSVAKMTLNYQNLN